MPGHNETSKPTSKTSGAKALKPKRVSDKMAAAVRGGRRDRLAANHNHTIRLA